MKLITTAELYWINAASGPMSKISVAQAAALTWSISCFSFLGQGTLLKSVWERPTSGVAAGSNAGLEYYPFQTSKLVHFLRYLAQFFILFSSAPYLSDLVSTAVYTAGLAYSNSSTTFTISFFILPCHYLSPLSSPLSLPLRRHLYSTHYHFSTFSMFPVLPSVLRRTLFPVDGT